MATPDREKPQRASLELSEGCEVCGGAVDFVSGVFVRRVRPFTSIDGFLRPHIDTFQCCSDECAKALDARHRLEKATD